MDNQERPNNRNQAENAGTIHMKKCTSRDNKARPVNSSRDLNMYYTNVDNSIMSKYDTLLALNDIHVVN